MTQTEALKLAHEELKHIKTWCLRSIGIGLVNENVLAKIEEALAQPEQERNFCSRCGKRFGSNDWDVHTCTPPQPEQEPAWYHAECNDPDHSGFFKEAIDAVTQVNEHGGFVTKLYITLPQRNPLTELQVRKIASSLRSGFTWFEFAQAIEAASTTTANPSNHVGFEKLSGEFSTAVSEPEQEPVANGYVFVAISILEKLGINKAVIDTIAATPPQRTWVGLTDDESVELMRQVPHLTIGGLLAVEAKLKEKNK